jgi:hypothetical protein
MRTNAYALEWGYASSITSNPNESPTLANSEGKALPGLWSGAVMTDVKLSNVKHRNDVDNDPHPSR